eukprot:g14398.t1
MAIAMSPNFCLPTICKYSRSTVLGERSKGCEDLKEVCRYGTAKGLLKEFDKRMRVLRIFRAARRHGEFAVMADVLASSLVANLCTGGAVLAVFSVALKFPQFAWAYTSRSDDERRKAGGAPERFCKRPEPLRPGLLGWLVMVFYVRERDVLDSCGPDAVLHLRILQLGYRAFSKILMVAIILILPTSLWLTRESGGDSFHRFGISAVPQGSSLLWVHFTANIWVNIICMRGIWKFMKGWVELRHEYLEALHSEGGGRTLIVQGVPTEYQDESAFHRYWKNTYHSAILRTLTGKNTNLLEKKVAEREKVVAALERAVAEWHVKKRSTHLCYVTFSSS